jgi:hypothetical protein
MMVCLHTLEVKLYLASIEPNSLYALILIHCVVTQGWLQSLLFSCFVAKGMGPKKVAKILELNHTSLEPFKYVQTTIFKLSTHEWFETVYHILCKSLQFGMLRRSLMDTNAFGCNYAVSRCNKTWAK